jgi:hypothetical protein
MGRSRWDECEGLVQQIESLARCETTLIDRQDFEAVWVGRNQRDELTKRLAALVSEESSEGEEFPDKTKEIIFAAVDRIQNWDEKNKQRLERQQQVLQRELQHLRTGRVAVSGYRWLKESTPSYVDKRS